MEKIIIRRKRIKIKLTLLLTLVLITLFVLFMYLTFEEVRPIIKAEINMRAVRSIVIGETDEKNPYERYVNFEQLEKINKDVIGWIYIPDTSIDYPILKGKTDTEYLDTDIDKNPNTVGSVFTYADSSNELTDKRTILFAHNMLQNQMFGELKEYFNTNFRSEHKKIYVYTKNRIMEYKLFSVFTCLETEKLFQHTVSENEYMMLYEKLGKRNQIEDLDDLDKNPTGEILSLVTCYGSFGTNERLMVNAIITSKKYWSELGS